GWPGVPGEVGLRVRSIVAGLDHRGDQCRHGGWIQSERRVSDRDLGADPAWLLSRPPTGEADAALLDEGEDSLVDDVRITGGIQQELVRVRHARLDGDPRWQFSCERAGPRDGVGYAWQPVSQSGQRGDGLRRRPVD